MAARGRKPIVVDKMKLQDVLVNIEWDGPLQSRNALWQAVAESDYAKSIKLSPQVAMLKAKAFGDSLMILTPLGKKGRSKGEAPPKANTDKAKRSRRISLEIVELLKKKFPQSMHRTVDRAAKGSLKAGVALNCMDCSGMQKGEVARCTIKNCTWWSFRPYKRKATTTVV
jgi:hypothetical protein